MLCALIKLVFLFCLGDLIKVKHDIVASLFGWDKLR